MLGTRRDVALRMTSCGKSKGKDGAGETRAGEGKRLAMGRRRCECMGRELR
jgi:hypothetical protein